MKRYFRGLIALTCMIACTVGVSAIPRSEKTAAPALTDVTDDSDATLRYYCSQAQAVVVAEAVHIVQHAENLDGENPLRISRCRFKVIEAIKEKDVVASEVGVQVRKFSDDPRPVLKRGGKYILFLRAFRAEREKASSHAPWVTADKWFGVSPYSGSLARGLQRVIATPTK